MSRHLGKYKIIERLPIFSNTWRSYTVVKQVPFKQMFIATLVRLNHELSLMENINQAKKISDNIIKEIFYVERSERVFMVVIQYSDIKAIKYAQLDIVTYTPSMCMRLMYECIDLIQQLHFMDLRLKLSIFQFLQIYKKQQAYNINLIKVNNQKIYLHEESIIKGQLNKEELSLFLSFSEYLAKKTSEKYKLHSNITSLIDALKQAQKSRQSQHSLQIKTIKRILNSFKIQHENHIVYVHFNEDEKSISALFMNDHNSKTGLYKQFGQIFEQKSKKKMSIDEIFYLLSTANSIKIKTKFNHYKLTFVDHNSEKSIEFKNKVNEQNVEQQGLDDIMLKQEEWQDEQGQSRQIIVPYLQKPIKQKEYPYNCIAFLYTQFDFDGVKKTCAGIGTLLSSKLIYTCAHNIHYKFMQCSNQRVQAMDCYAGVPGNKWIRVKKWFVPQQYTKDKKYDREYDYALLELEQQVNNFDGRYLELVYDYEQIFNVQLIHFERNKNNIFNIIKQNKQNKKCKIFNSAKCQELVTHPFITQRGDSGTPLLIQPQQLGGNCFVIGNNVGKKWDYKWCRLIGTDMIDKFEQWQTKSMEKYFSQIRVNSLSYNHIKNMQTEISEQLYNINNTLLKKFENIPRSKNQCDPSKAEYFIEQSHNIITQGKSIFKKDHKQYEQLLNNFKQNEDYFNRFMDEDSQPFTNELKDLLIIIYSSYSYLGIEQNEQSRWQYFLKMLFYLDSPDEDSQYKIYHDSMNLDSLFWKANYHLSDNRFDSILEAEMIINYLLTIQILFDKIGLKIPSKQMMLKHILYHKKRTQKHRKITKFQAVIVGNPFQYIKPICAFKTYDNQQTQIVELDLVLSFKTRQQQGQVYYQLQNFNHEYFKFPYIRRSQQKYLLDFIIEARIVKEVNYFTISQCLKNNKLSTLQWIEVMVKMAEFIQFLHRKKLELSVPLDLCMFVDVKNITPVFFYYQNVQSFMYQYYQALYYSQRLNDHQILPTDEVLHSKIMKIKGKSMKNLDLLFLGHIYQKIYNTFYEKMNMEVYMETLILNMISDQPIASVDVQTVKYELQHIKNSLSMFGYVF